MKKLSNHNLYEMVESLLQLGMREEHFVGKLTWFPINGKLHGHHRCEWPRSYRPEVPFAVEEYTGPRVEKTIFEVKNKKLCSRCSIYANIWDTLEYRAGLAILQRYVDLQEPLPKDPEELLEYLIQERYRWADFNTLRYFEKLEDSNLDVEAEKIKLSALLKAKNLEAKRLFHSKKIEKRILGEVKRKVKSFKGDTALGVLALRTKVHPASSTFSLVAMHYCVAALNPEISARVPEKGLDPIYIIVAPMRVIKFLEGCTQPVFVQKLDVPASTSAEVFETALKIWDADEHFLDGLEKAILIAKEI